MSTIAASRPRRILVVAYHFPPLGGAGAQRWVKHCKYLPALGWDPIVVTTRSRRYWAHDESLMEGLPPGLPILRAREFGAGRRVRRVLKRAGLPAPPLLEGWPDKRAGWIPDATRLALRAVRQLRPDVMVTTSPSASALVVGLAVQRLTGVPWVADFRDELVHNPWPEPRPRVVRAATRRLEAEVCRRADLVLVTTDVAQLVGAPPCSPRRRTLTNGVDVSDVPCLQPAPSAERFVLSFVGSLYAQIDLAPVLAALRRLAEHGAIDPSRCEVRVVGNSSVAGLDAGPVPLVQTGYVDHARAVAEMASAGALLCYVPPQGHPTPGKIFEYLASGRPVLCVTTPQNFAWRLVDDLGAGICADPRDALGIEKGITELYAHWQCGALAVPPGTRAAVLERFSRRRLAEDLTGMLDEMLQLPRSVPAAPVAPRTEVLA